MSYRIPAFNPFLLSETRPSELDRNANLYKFAIALFPCIGPWMHGERHAEIAAEFLLETSLDNRIQLLRLENQYNAALAINCLLQTTFLVAITVQALFPLFPVFTGIACCVSGITLLTGCSSLRAISNNNKQIRTLDCLNSATS
jgi:hypothetical protein